MSEPNWWQPLLAASAPRILILKGSMSGLRQSSSDELILDREMLLGPIFEKGGIIIEGSSNSRGPKLAEWARNLNPDRTLWEFTDGDPRLAKPKRKFELDSVNYGYENKVRGSYYKGRGSL